MAKHCHEFFRYCAIGTWLRVEQEMYMLYRVTAVAAILTSCLWTCGVQADVIATYEVGIGNATSNVQIDFPNNNAYIFEVSYEDDGTYTGWDLLQIISQSLPSLVSLEYQTFEWGHWLQGIGIDEDYAFGTGAGFPEFDDYWAYWVSSSSPTPNWDYAPVGADARLVSSGSWDGWTFHPNGAAPPQAIPGPAALWISCLVGICAKRRRRSPYII